MTTENDNDNPKPPARFPSPFTRYTHHGHRDAEARAANTEHQREYRLRKAAARSSEGAS